jgi:hypothetical protein
LARITYEDGRSCRFATGRYGTSSSFAHAFQASQLF